MSKIYNHERGLFLRKRTKEDKDTVIPEFTWDQKSYLCVMLGVQTSAARRSGKNVITYDPEDYLGVQERKGQQIIRTMGENGLILTNPGLIFTISEQDWPVEDRIGFMMKYGILATDYTNLINKLQKRQQLPTGVIPVLDKKLQMRGKTFPEMVELNETASREISRATMNKYGSRMLGILANLDYHTQSREKRAEMASEGGLREYMEDVTIDGKVATIYKDYEDVIHNRQAHLRVWDASLGCGPQTGTRLGVVQTGNS